MTKKVWHLISNRWNSAITEYALSSARALEKVGVSCVFTSLEYSPANQRARNLGLDTLPVRKFSLANLDELREKASSINADSIILYGGPETFLAKFLGKRRFIRFFGQDLNPNVLRIPFLFSLSYSHVSKFISPNSIIGAQIKGRVGSKPSRGIILGLEPLRSHHQTDERKQLVILGRLDPVKGHERMLRIFALALHKWPSNQPKPFLHIVGQDANLSAKQIRNLVDHFHLGSDVLITNERVSKVENLLGAACLGLIPSLGSEHICRVAEEFLLVGTPILVSGAGATEEVLFPGAGDSYKGLSDEVTADKLIQCILRAREESKVERESRSHKARELFSLEVMGKKLEQFIFD